jgi:hypothetical protein
MSEQGTAKVAARVIDSPDTFNNMVNAVLAQLRNERHQLLHAAA